MITPNHKQHWLAEETNLTIHYPGIASKTGWPQSTSDLGRMWVVGGHIFHGHKNTYIPSPKHIASQKENKAKHILGVLSEKHSSNLGELTQHPVGHV